MLFGITSSAKQVSSSGKNTCKPIQFSTITDGTIEDEEDRITAESEYRPASRPNTSFLMCSDSCAHSKTTSNVSPSSSEKRANEALISRTPPAFFINRCTWPVTHVCKSTRRSTLPDTHVTAWPRLRKYIPALRPILPLPAMQMFFFTARRSLPAA